MRSGGKGRSVAAGGSTAMSQYVPVTLCLTALPDASPHRQVAPVKQPPIYLPTRNFPISYLRACMPQRGGMQAFEPFDNRLFQCAYDRADPPPQPQTLVTGEKYRPAGQTQILPPLDILRPGSRLYDPRNRIRISRIGRIYGAAPRTANPFQNSLARIRIGNQILL